MLRFLALVCLVVAAVLPIEEIHAQSTQTTAQTITLPEAINSAYANSPALRTVELNARNPILERQALLAEGRPQLKYKAGLAYAPATPYFGYDPALTNEGQFNAQIILDGIIYDAGVRQMKLQQASIDSGRMTGQIARARANLKLQVIQNFADAIRTSLQLQIEEQSLSEAKDNLDLTKRLYAGGTLGYSDVLKSEIQYKQEQSAMLKAEDDNTVALLALKETAGLPLDEPLAIRFSVDSLIAVTKEAYALSDSAASLDMALAQKDLESAKLDVDIARAATKPVISFTADGGLLSSMQNILAATPDRVPFWGAQAGISIDGTLLDWGANNFRVEQKQLALENVQYELDLLQRQQRALRNRVLLALRRIGDRIRQLDQAVASAEENYRLAKARFAGGGIGMLELIDAHKQIVDLQTARVQLLSDIQSYQASLDRTSTTGK